MNILTKKEIEEIRQKSIYWEEVIKRGDNTILTQELYEITNILGIKILIILKEYIKTINN